MTNKYSQKFFNEIYRRFIYTIIFIEKKGSFFIGTFLIQNFILSNLYAQTCSTTNLYDAVTSAYHQSVAKKSDGTWVTWGQLVANNGSSSVLSPQIINSSNYSALTGTPLYATTASNGGGSDEQSVLLTTTGLFAWGKEGIVLANALTTNTTFQKLTINSKADGLPTDVLPADVRMLFAMNNTLAIVTSTGSAYVISKGSVKVLGDGTSSLDANWHQVKTAVNTPLTNIVAIRGQVSSATEGALFALTSDNKIYTWGETIYKGDGSNSTSSTYAVEMTLPSGASGTPKMIGVTGGTNTTGKNSYFLLYSSGSLYSMGLNDLKQLGDRTTTEQKSWVSVKDPLGNPFTDVKTISLQEHDSKIPAGALITNDGKLYVWGQGEKNMLGGLSGTTVTSDPFLASGTEVAKLVEFGGHTLVYVKEGSSKFCYVGHKVNGSMGDGTSTDTDVATFDCTSTPTVDICGASTPLDAGSIGSDQMICTGATSVALSSSTVANGGTGSISYQWQRSTDNNTFIDIASATTTGYTPGVLTQTTYFRRGAKTLTDVIVYSNVVTITVNSIPSAPTSSGGSNCGTGTVSMTASGCVGGTVSWYGSLTGGSALTTGTNFTTLSIISTTTYYIDCTLSGCTSSSRNSAVATITPIPTISNQPSSSIQNLCLNQSATALSVSVAGGSGYGYQWYSNSTSSNSGGTLINGATSSSYTPLTSVVGTTYYYCVVSYTSCIVATQPSSPLVVSPQTITSTISGAVIVGGSPTISNQPSSSIQNLCLNQSATALSVSVAGGSGYGYQWYSNSTSSNSGGTLINGATSSSYTPLTSVVGTTYYYCVVSYTSCSVPTQPNSPLVVSPQTITSTISGAVIVTICSTPPTISRILPQTINSNSSTTALPFTISDVQTPVANLLLSVVSSDTILMPRSRIVLAGSDSSRTIKLTPVLGRTGSSQITISVTDSDNLTSSTNFSFTVNEQPPTIGVLPDQIINVNSSTPSRNFVVRSDVATLSVTGFSSNASLVPDASIFFTGTGVNRSIVITPTPGLVGNSVITIEVKYSDGSSEYIVFTLTVVNTVPYLSSLKNVNLCLSTIGSVPFVIGDNETPTQDLVLTITSSNNAIISRSEIQVTGTGHDKILTLSPSSKQFGSSLITITVTDNAGTFSTQTFTFTLNPCDSDNDGIPDEIECPGFTNCLDADGDGTPNYLDTDSDNDGIGDVVEKNIDSDGDSIPDYLDTDSDNDGIPDLIEGYIDSDGDGIMNYLDLDSDGDSIEDRIESYIDSDRDGIANYLDIDSDNDNINDRVEGVVDTDGDGFPNYIDGDSDNDGIPDGIEGRVNDGVPVDTDADGAPDYIDLDSDNDGIPDKIEKNTIIVADGKVINQPLDSDGDGKPDYLDLDSDNDGIPDSVEAGLTPNEPIDSDNDIQPDYLDLDSDNDTIPDKVEAGINPSVPVDTDGDAKPDYLDLDSDDDTIPDKVEAGINPSVPVDTDGDAKSDYLDLDSDNDTIPDKVEAGGNPSVPIDTDGDAKPNYLDLDSDNDTIPDKVEAGSNPSVPIDTDGDAKPNYLDLDSDNDNIPDKVEAGSKSSTPVDTDGDSYSDYLDLDSDNDTIPDKVEAGNNPSVPVDTDGDSKPDYLDLDSDNDELQDSAEAGINPNVPVDTDADGLMDFRDTDSDNDKILDKLEDNIDFGNVPDCDNDNVPNYIDADQCETFTPEGISPNGDGRNDVLIIPGIKSKNNNRIAIYNRWGSLVYEKENYQNDWGGEANVKNIVLQSDGLLPDGTYYYVVLFDNKQATKAGFIYINRLNN